MPSSRDSLYGLYILAKLLLRHLLPMVLVVLCLLRPRCIGSSLLQPKLARTFAAKRISLIFLGEPAVCECGPSGAELGRPHECPKMARWGGGAGKTSWPLQVPARHPEGHRGTAGPADAPGVIVVSPASYLNWFLRMRE